MVSATASLNPPKRVFIFSPLIDIVVLGGMSILFFAIFQAMDLMSPYMRMNESGAQALMWLNWIVNQPHYSATYYRVYRSWSETKRYEIVSMWLPLVLLGITVWCFLAPHSVAPWFCKAYFISVSYHYAGQSYGIALIFMHKAGIAVNRWIKVCLGIPIYTSAVLWLIGDEVITQRRYFSGVTLPVAGFPPWTYLLALCLLIWGVALYVIMSFVLARSNRKIPLVVHIVVLAQLIWFTMAPRLEYFALLVPFFHCIQYLVITTYFRLQELVRGGKISQAASGRFFTSPYFWRYYALLIVVGLILFNGIPQGLAFLKVSNADFAYAVIYSFINLHHFLLDGEIWKLRKPDIGKALI